MAASLPGAELFSQTSVFFEQATCPGQLRCLGQNFFSQTRTFRNSGTPVRRTNRWKYQKMNFPDFWDSCAQNQTSEISKNALPGILGLLCAEQDVGNLKQCTFRNCGTPARRTKRRKSQKMDAQEFCGACALNKPSEISKNEPSTNLGLLCADQNVGHLKKMTFRNSGTPARRTKHLEYQKCTFRNYGTPVRRTKRRKSQKCTFRNS